MIEYDTTNTPSKIIIPVTNRQEILRYQQGVLGILHKIVLPTQDRALKENIKTVYELLGHLHCEENIAQLLNESSVTPGKISRFQKMRKRNDDEQ